MKTLKNNNNEKWIINENGKELNLNFSGFSALFKVGFLW